MRTTNSQTLEVNPSDLIVDPAEQATYRFGKPDVDKLTADMKEKGQLTPVVAIRSTMDSNEGLRLAFGFGRYEAAKRLGILLKVEVFDWTQKRQLYLRNLHDSTDQMTHMDLAVSIRRMISEMGMTQQEIARWFNKSQSWVSQHVSMFRLDQDTQQKVHSGEIPWSVAVAISQATPEERAGMLEAIENAKYTAPTGKSSKAQKWAMAGIRRPAPEVIALFEKVIVGNYHNRLKRLANIMVDFLHTSSDDRVTIEKLDSLLSGKPAVKRVWRKKRIGSKK